MTQPLQVDKDALARVGRQMAEHAPQLRDKFDAGRSSADVQGSYLQFLAHYLKGLSFAAALLEVDGALRDANRRVCGEYENFGQTLAAAACALGESDERAKAAIESAAAA